MVIIFIYNFSASNVYNSPIMLHVQMTLGEIQVTFFVFKYQWLYMYNQTFLLFESLTMSADVEIGMHSGKKNLLQDSERLSLVR